MGVLKKKMNMYDIFMRWFYCARTSVDQNRLQAFIKSDDITRD